MSSWLMDQPVLHLAGQHVFRQGGKKCNICEKSVQKHILNFFCCLSECPVTWELFFYMFLFMPFQIVQFFIPPKNSIPEFRDFPDSLVICI